MGLETGFQGMSQTLALKLAQMKNHREVWNMLLMRRGLLMPGKHAVSTGGAICPPLVILRTDTCRSRSVLCLRCHALTLRGVLLSLPPRWRQLGHSLAPPPMGLVSLSRPSSASRRHLSKETPESYHVSLHRSRRSSSCASPPVGDALTSCTGHWSPAALPYNTSNPRKIQKLKK